MAGFQVIPEGERAGFRCGSVAEFRLNGRSFVAARLHSAAPPQRNKDSPRKNIFLDDGNKLVHDKNASAAESKYRFPSVRNPYSHRNGKAILFTGIRTACDGPNRAIRASLAESQGRVASVTYADRGNEIMLPADPELHNHSPPGRHFLD
jgi:hypothetical protein